MFDGKFALVTGTSQGIGRETAKLLAKRGAAVACVDVNPDGLDSLRQELEAYGHPVLTYQCDVSDESKVNDIAADVLARWGRLDILINNAGGTAGRQDQLIPDIPLSEWKDMIDNNMTAMFLMSTEFARRLMAANKGGRIVNLLSKASLTTTTKGRACYVTNKTGQMGLTKQLAVDLTDKGIICNGIMPGTVKNQKFTAMDENDPRYKARLKRLPMGRYGEPYEFGKMVAFLASEECQLAVGAVVDFTGGMMLGF